MEDKAMADGRISRAERTRIDQAMDGQDRRITREIRDNDIRRDSGDNSSR
ncbi:MAG: hypothetical protein WCK63_12005 [Betaproteobacteria bacterium]